LDEHIVSIFRVKSKPRMQAAMSNYELSSSWHLFQAGFLIGLFFRFEGGGKKLL
jgi:hypothetical protein